jgi:hypothetical protein
MQPMPFSCRHADNLVKLCIFATRELISHQSTKSSGFPNEESVAIAQKYPGWRACKRVALPLDQRQWVNNVDIGSRKLDSGLAVRVRTLVSESRGRGKWEEVPE